MMSPLWWWCGDWFRVTVYSRSILDIRINGHIDTGLVRCSKFTGYHRLSKQGGGRDKAEAEEEKKVWWWWPLRRRRRRRRRRRISSSSSSSSSSSLDPILNPGYPYILQHLYSRTFSILRKYNSMNVHSGYIDIRSSVHHLSDIIAVTCQEPTLPKRKRTSAGGVLCP